MVCAHPCHQPAPGVLSLQKEKATASQGCPQPLPRGSNSPALSRDVEVRTPWRSFLSSVPLLLFYQYSSRSSNVNESSGLQIFSLWMMGIRYLPG